MDHAFGRRSVVARISQGGQIEGPESVADAPPGANVPDFAPAEEKYELLAGIGAGGMGEVVLVHDRDLRREVAMKMIRTEHAGHAALRRKFVAEAQATSQLEHPGIPPVHDIGITPEGRIYFTMKVVRGRTLATILRDLVLGVKEARQEYTLHKLVSVLERISEAVHFAHEKGVVHRDLKPENVMLGAYGEVHVMDWGIAKVTSSAGEDESGDETVRTVETDTALMTQVGTVKGTIPYMSPEQARGAPLDRRTDVYALGAILYEILTLHPAFEGSGPQLVLKVRAGEYPDVAARNPRRPVPEGLAALCRRAMSMDAAARPASAREFGEGLRSFLDGRAEKERRHKEAEALAAQGREATARYASAHDAIDEAERTAKEEEGKVQSWEPVTAKAALLAAKKALAQAQRNAAHAFAEATKLLEGALLAEPENASARAALADLWRSRLDDAERRNDPVDGDFALTMVRRYDDGRLAAYISGEGSLELETDRAGAEVVLLRYEDRDGILVPGPEQVLGRTPLAKTPLPMGSYLVLLRHPRFPEVRYPVHITRNRAWKGRVTLRTKDEIGDGFVYVPGGPFVFGEGKETKVLELPDFAVAQKPITFADWAEFLAAVEKEEGLEAAKRLVPNVKGDGEYLERGDDGSWRVKPGLTAGPAEASLIARHGAGFETRMPVVGVSWHDAVAYCAWKTKTTGREWRLPTEEEREKAARGVDGRAYPWGDLADATLGKCVDSRAEVSQPEPVGSFPTATSIYGMIDAAGNTSDWTDSWFDHRAAVRVLRGGSWNNVVGNLRCAFRNRNVPGFRNSNFGFRPARSVSS
jgi:serine/threonine-protein kinase